MAESTTPVNLLTTMNKQIRIETSIHLEAKKKALEVGETLQQFVESAVSTRLAMMLAKAAKRKEAK